MSKNDNNIKLRNGRAWPEVFAKTDVFGGIHVLLERNIPKGLLMRRQLIVTVMLIMVTTAQAGIKEHPSTLPGSTLDEVSPEAKGWRHSGDADAWRTSLLDVDALKRHSSLGKVNATGVVAFTTSERG